MIGRQRLAVAALAVALFAQPLLPDVARAQYQSNPANEFAVGFGSFLLSPFYGAVKVTFALCGAVVGGFTWAFSGGNTDAASAVWEPTLRGTYVLAPEYLRGEKPIQFIGPRSKQ